LTYYDLFSMVLHDSIRDPFAALRTTTRAAVHLDPTDIVNIVKIVNKKEVDKPIFSDVPQELRAAFSA
jgi:hypothetical protein